jgi:hypothetical protein
MATCLAGAGAPARLTASGRSARGLVRLQMACTLPRAVPAVPRLAVHVQPRTATSCAAAAACAGPAQPSPLPGRPSDAVISSLAVLCRNVLVGVAAAVAWSVAASAIAPGSTAPLASLSLAGSGPSGSGRMFTCDPCSSRALSLSTMQLTVSAPPSCPQAPVSRRRVRGRAWRQDFCTHYAVPIISRCGSVTNGQ